MTMTPEERQAEEVLRVLAGDDVDFFLYYHHPTGDNLLSNESEYPMDVDVRNGPTTNYLERHTLAPGEQRLITPRHGFKIFGVCFYAQSMCWDLRKETEGHWSFP